MPSVQRSSRDSVCVCLSSSPSLPRSDGVLRAPTWCWDFTLSWLPLTSTSEPPSQLLPGSAPIGTTLNILCPTGSGPFILSISYRLGRESSCNYLRPKNSYSLSLWAAQNKSCLVGSCSPRPLQARPARDRVGLGDGFSR